MSISPSVGQLGPTIQKAGQAPQAWAGKCEKSAMNRPLLYVLALSSLTLLRPFWSKLLAAASTLIVTSLVVLDTRPRLVASCLLRYLTKPWLGSEPLKKLNLSKKLEGVYDSLSW